MTECDHGQQPGIYCPPCDGTVGRRLPDWTLVRRQDARWPAVCAGCGGQVEAGQHAAFWTDRHRDDSGLTITCGTCHPSGDGRPPPLGQLVGGDLACPACGGRLKVDGRREWRMGRWRLPTDLRRPSCTRCHYVHRAKGLEALREDRTTDTGDLR